MKEMEWTPFHRWIIATCADMTSIEYYTEALESTTELLSDKNKVISGRKQITGTTWRICDLATFDKVCFIILFDSSSKICLHFQVQQLRIRAASKQIEDAITLHGGSLQLHSGCNWLVMIHYMTLHVCYNALQCLHDFMLNKYIYMSFIVLHVCMNIIEYYMYFTWFWI